jgi:hypothetical protein
MTSPACGDTASDGAGQASTKPSAGSSSAVTCTDVAIARPCQSAAGQDRHNPQLRRHERARSVDLDQVQGYQTSAAQHAGCRWIRHVSPLSSPANQRPPWCRLNDKPKATDGQVLHSHMCFLCGIENSLCLRLSFDMAEYDDGRHVAPRPFSQKICALVSFITELRA